MSSFVMATLLTLVLVAVVVGAENAKLETTSDTMLGEERYARNFGGDKKGGGGGGYGGYGGGYGGYGGGYGYGYPPPPPPPYPYPYQYPPYYGGGYGYPFYG